MEKIDRLEWAADLAFVAHGLAIGIRTNEPAILEQLQDRLPPGRRRASTPRVERLYSLVGGGSSPSRGVRRLNLLYVNEMRLARSRGLPEVLRALETDLELYVAERARRRLFLHAGVVGWQGRAVLIPGRSMSGKSHLVAAWLEAGATYYSDEYAVLDDRGRVHPYPRPLRLRDGPGGNASRGRHALDPLPVGLVVVTRYRAGARWRPRVISPGQAGLEVLAHTAAARRRPGAALTMLARALSGARALKGERGEAVELVNAVVSGAHAVATP